MKIQNAEKAFEFNGILNEIESVSKKRGELRTSKTEFYNFGLRF